jgi:hypothetical protein
MRRRILTWVAGLVGGTMVLTLVALLVITQSRSSGSAPEGVDTSPPAGLPGTSDAPTPKPDTNVASQPNRDPNQKFANVGPLDSTLVGLGRGPRQRAAMDGVLRKGIFYEIKEVKPDFMRVIAGSAFFSQPYKYRNPLVRDLYHAYNEGRPAGHPYCIELWSMRNKFGEYVSDTFFFGPRYSKPR